MPKLRLDEVRRAALDGTFAGEDWFDGSPSCGARVEKDGRVRVEESTANPLTQLLYLALCVGTESDGLRALVEAPDAAVYDRDWGSRHPGFRDRMRACVSGFQTRFVVAASPTK